MDATVDSVVATIKATTTIPTTTEDVVKSTDAINENKFGVWDYVVFGGMLLLSALIGIFFAIKDRKKKNVENYLLGGRKMSGWPVALSLTASFMSAITVLGTPAEFYLYGPMYFWFFLSYFTVAVIAAEIIVPVFYNLGITSTYEYLEIRFSKAVRLAGTSTFTLLTVLYMGLVIYMPALALNKVTGVSLQLSICITAGVCTFYTSIGGIKAVIWTDVLQCMIMLGGFVAIVVKGSSVVGGIDEVFRIAHEGGRTDFFVPDFDPRVRHSFWAVWLGGTFMWLAIYGVNQSMVQRYLSCKSYTHVRIALYMNAVGMLVIIILAGLAGITMYAIYYDCDPLDSGKITKSDQLAPYTVMDILSSNPGLPGLFVASAYSGTLSTVSTGINALACTTLEDFVKSCCGKIQDRNEIILSKLLVVFYGLVALAVAFLASLMDQVLTLALKLFAVIGGPLLGMFFLGLFLPCANSAGAITGLLSGLVIGFWLAVGSFLYPPGPEFTMILKRSTEGCDVPVDPAMPAYYNTTTMPYLNQTLSTAVEEEYPAIANYFYSLSYCYYAPFLVLCTFGIGLIVSLITCGAKSRKQVNKGTLSFGGCCCGPSYDDFQSNYIPGEIRKK